MKIGFFLLYFIYFSHFILLLFYTRPQKLPNFEFFSCLNKGSYLVLNTRERKLKPDAKRAGKKSPGFRKSLHSTAPLRHELLSSFTQSKTSTRAHEHSESNRVKKFVMLLCNF